MLYSHEVSPTDRNRLKWTIRFSEKGTFGFDSETMKKCVASYTGINV